MNLQSAYPQKFFIYARKSTDVEDMQIRSIEDQLSVLREFAQRENLSVCQEFIEKQSAKIPGRPIFNEMVSQIEKGYASGILSWHPDRLARNGVDGGKILYLLDTGTIKALKFPQFWFEPTAQGKFMLSLAFGQSKYYVDSLSENTKRGLHQKAKSGEYPGIPPMGYLNDPRTKTIVLNRKLGPIVKQLFEKFATGQYKIQDMAGFLAQHGLKTKGGKILRDQTSKILQNPFYYGYFRYTGELLPGKHSPIISKKLFDQCQEVIKPKSRKWKEERPVKPLTGLFRCGECGMGITAEVRHKYYATIDRHAYYTYYRCTKKSKTVINCSQKYVREGELDSQLTQLLQKVSLPQDVADNWLLKLEKEKMESASSCLVFVQDKRSQMDELTKKIQKLTDVYLDQDIDREEYLQRKNAFVSQKRTLEEEIIRFEQKQNNWLGPFREWILEASQVSTIASGNDLNQKKVLALKVYGSNLRLQNRLARGEVLERWAALRAAPTTRNWEPMVRIGLTTCCLQNSCSTIELHRHGDYLGSQSAVGRLYQEEKFNVRSQR